MSKRQKYIWEEEPEIDNSTESSFEIFNEEPEIDNKPRPKKIIKKPKKKKSKKKINKKPPLIPLKIKLIIVLVITIIVSAIIFIPYKMVATITISELSFVVPEDILSKLSFKEGERISSFELSKNQKLLKEMTIGEVTSSYDKNTDDFKINVIEAKPLALDEKGTFYYSDLEGLHETTAMSYQVPFISGFKDTQIDKLVSELNTLDYNVIKEISSIAPGINGVSDELVVMTMKDGNYVEIDTSLISDKMPYYLQMQTIINSVNGGKPGILHLDIGDYYEPIN